MGQSEEYHPKRYKAKVFDKYLLDTAQKSNYKAGDIEILLNNICSFGVETEEYSKHANKTAQTLKRQIKKNLEDYLEQFKRIHSLDVCIDKKELDKAFTAFYLVVYYERQYEEMENLRNTLDTYYQYFDEYALAGQIKGRYLRRVGKEKEALICDRQAKIKLEKKGISNIWVDVTYASTISLLMEKRDPSVTTEDITTCMENISLAKERHPDYAKFHYLYAKLLMFSLVNGNNNTSFEECCKIIDESKRELQKGIEKENKNKDYYLVAITEYKSYIREADLILAELRLKNSIDSQSNKLILQIEERFGKLQAKSMELLALFSSIVAIIVVAIGLFSKDYALKSVLIAIIVMNTCVLAVYSVLLLLIDNENDDGYRKSTYVLVLIVAILIISYIFKMA